MKDQQHQYRAAYGGGRSSRFDPSLRDLVHIIWQRRGVGLVVFVGVLAALSAGIANWDGRYRSVAEIGFSQDRPVGEGLVADRVIRDRPAITAQEIETAIAEIKGEETLSAALAILRGEGVSLPGNENDDHLIADVITWIGARQNTTAKQNDPGDQDRGTDLLRSRLEANRTGNAAVVEISFEATQPEIAQRALEVIAQSYLWYRENRQKRSIRRQLEEAVLQFDAAQTELAGLEQDLAGMQTSAGMLDADERARMLDRIYALDEQAEKLGQEVAGLTNAQKGRSGLTSVKDLLAISEVASHPHIQQLSQKLDAKQEEFTTLDQRYGPKHPIMQGKQRELSKLRDELESAVRTVARQMDVALISAREKLRLIRAQRQSWEDRVALRNIETQGQTGLIRAVGFARANLQDIGQQVQRLRREIAGFHGDAAILRAPSLPVATEFPGKRDLLVLAIMIALFAAMVAVLLRHYFDQSINDDFDPEQTFGIPLFGRIPLSQASQAAVVDGNAAAAHDEAVGHLAVLMRLMHQTGTTEPQSHLGGQVIALGSAVSGDGKSHMAHTLATGLAGLGASVVVLDADLHDPAPPLCAHDVGETQPDLVSIMAGDEKIDAALARPQAGAGYFYLGARLPVPGHIATGLIEGHLADIVADLRPRFDHVIIDTPPILSVADGVIAHGLADVSLFVSRCKHSKHRDIDAALTQLRTARIIPDGVVINGAKPRTPYGKASRTQTPQAAL
ncbi:GumC family protein [Thalassospira sp.]|uniref:GumC family protein n=1 Tax=Thalassospira sp. TaxID=1912094 RepID=UPI003AA8CAE7